MALCLKCLIGTGGQGGGLLPPDIERFRVELVFTPDTEEANGERRAVFEGEVLRGDPLDGGVSAVGILDGNFGLDADESLQMTAHVETFTRNGSIAFVTLNVHEGGERSGSVVFSASLTPQQFDVAPEEMTFDAAIFMGRAAAAMAG
ncbi:MAG: hypothetical protein QOG90_210 [Actinomycetota bacterium]|jgi:hypothetical protein